MTTNGRKPASGGLPKLPVRCRVSIIIPARDDAAALAASLGRLACLEGIETAEIIVASAGDTEGTACAVAGRARLLAPGDATRAGLMNAGAATASGEILFFLHADSVPPPAALHLIEQAMADDHVVGGAFEHRFAERDWRLRIISTINRVRYRLTRNYYGDQGIFVRADVFRRLGGYPSRRLLEDLEFSRRLKQVGRTVLIRVPVETAGRRFLARGPWRTFGFIVWLLGRHTLGLDTERYAEYWRGPSGRPPGSPWDGLPPGRGEVGDSESTGADRA
jgi:rSAM/selenodomain-associated transferase 2